MKTAMLALLALSLASPARADNEMTAGHLYSLCTSADEDDLTSCRFYVFGVVQGVYRVLRMLRKDRGFTVAVVVLRLWCSRLTGN